VDTNVSDASVMQVPIADGKAVVWANSGAVMKVAKD
jgi:hypothetical protein